MRQLREKTETVNSVLPYIIKRFLFVAEVTSLMVSFLLSLADVLS